MMEEFLPSEIARAVYGYLLSEGCEDAAKTFLETAPSLVECKQRIKHGKRLTHANTLLLGKNLVEVLNIACSVHSIVKQILDKQRRGDITEGHESLSVLLDQLRSCVLSESRIDQNSSSLPPSQPEPQCLSFSPHHLRTPPATAASLAENYRSLVQECSEGFDLSLSPGKPTQKNKNVESPSSQRLNRPTSAPGALGLSQLDMDNESAIAAITGMGSVVPNVPQVVAVATPLTTMAVTSATLSAAVTTPAVVTTKSHPAVGCPQNNHVITADALPDPPIFVLNNQNQSFEGGDPMAAYLNLPPCATSTPHPRPAFMPEDTAFIVYPPLAQNPKPKKVLKEKTIPRRSGRLRKLLPKPLRKDPPNVIHINVLPQTIDEESEDDTDDVNEMELAKELPHSEENIVSESVCGKDPVKECVIQQEENIQVVATTSDKENISDENILRGETIENSNNDLASECVKETSTPRPRSLRKNISRSTPRRNSHVRALSFNTPLKPTLGRKSNTSPKMPKIKFSPKSTKLSCVKRSSLFSPPNKKELSYINEDEDAVTNQEGKDQEEIDIEKSQAFLDNSALEKVPIATRSPVPKLSSAWQEVNDVKITEKPVWDEKIRNFALGDFEDPAPPPKKGTQNKQANMSLSPKKVNNNVNINSNNHSSAKNEQDPCQRNNSKSKKITNIPGKSPTANKTEEVIEPLQTSTKTINTSAKTLLKRTMKPGRKKKKASPLKKTNKKQSNLNSKEEVTFCSKVSDQNRQNFNEDSHINISEKTGTVCELPTDSQNPVELKKSNVENNILLEDLVLSSNSCFPQTNDDAKSESNLVKENASQINDSNKKEISLLPKTVDNIGTTDSINISSSVFIQPCMVVLETPSKEFQACGSKMFALTTPLIKSIRQETSILEEDLLLTPSLPPTPQINSSPRNLIKTPCKTVIDLPTVREAQTSLPSLGDGESKSCQKPEQRSSKVTSRSKSTEEKRHILSSSSGSESERYENIGSTCSTLKTHPLPEKKIIQSKLRPSIKTSKFTTTDTSEDEMDNHKNNSDLSKNISKENSVRERKMLKNSRNRIYSTTESSDDETYTTKIISDSAPVKTKLSKLASDLLENERKNLNKKLKKTEVNKKYQVSGKSPSQHSPGSVSSGTQDTRKLGKGRKKSYESVTDYKKPRNSKDKSPKHDLNPKDSTENQVTPDNIRQQLQSDLLKHERRIIFGDGFNFSSDSESAKEVFEKKKNVTKKTKVKKCTQKKKKLDAIVLSEDSSVDNSSQVGLRIGNCVRFATNENFSGDSLRSPNNNQNSLRNNSEELHLSADKTNRGSVSTPSTLSESNEPEKNHGQENICQDKINENSATSNLTSINHNITSSVIIVKLPTERSENTCYNTMDKESNLCSENMVANKYHTYTADLSDKSGVSDNSEDEIDTRVASCDKDILKSPNPEPTVSPQPLKMAEQMEEVSSHTNEEGNEICITSTSTSKRINNTYLLDLDRRDTFEVDEGNVTLSFSEIIKHHYYSPSTRSECPQSDRMENTQSSTHLKTSVADKRVTFKEQAEKRRIKLIPIEEDKYEKKLKVNHYVIEPGNILINRDDKQFNSEIDILDCSTSTTDSHLNKQNISCRDSNESNEGNSQKCELDPDKDPVKEISAGENEINPKEMSVSRKEIKTNLVQTQEKHSNDTSRYKKVIGDKGINYEVENESISKGQRSSHSRHRYERESQYESPRNKSRSENNSTSQSYSRRRERREGSRSRYNRRDHSRRYSERWRRESDRRGFSERRSRLPHIYTRRDCSPDSQTNRHDSKRTFSAKNHDKKSILENLSKIEKLDLDRVDKLDQNSTRRLVKQERLDPRSTQALTYSDVDSSRDESDSLMDFAVVTKSKNNRHPENSPKSPPLMNVSAQQSPPNNSKRKASSSNGESLDTRHVEKKLKLGEVEMKEAKSVLKHKMADMLNVLHPDTSNEAS